MKQPAQRRLLDHPAGIHHHDPVGDLGDHAQIVGDEDHRHAGRAPAASQKLQDLRLHGDVKRGGRLVGDQDVGSQASAMAIMTRWRMPPESWCG